MAESWQAFIALASVIRKQHPISPLLLIEQRHPPSPLLLVEQYFLSLIKLFLFITVISVRFYSISSGKQPTCIGLWVVTSYHCRHRMQSVQRTASSSNIMAADEIGDINLIFALNTPTINHCWSNTPDTNSVSCTMGKHVFLHLFDLPLSRLVYQFRFSYKATDGCYECHCCDRLS